MDEKLLLSLVQNPFIVQLHNTYKNPKKLYMLLEMVQGGELYRRIHPLNGAKDGISESGTKIIIETLANFYNSYFYPFINI